MTETFFAELLARYGLATVVVLAVGWAAWRGLRAATSAGFDAARSFGQRLIQSIDDLAEVVKDHVEQSNARAERHSTELAGVSERLARIEARRDERDEWRDATPVQAIDDTNGRKRTKP